MPSKYEKMLLEKSTNLVEMFSEDFPHVRPLNTDTIHVVIGDLDQLL